MKTRAILLAAAVSAFIAAPLMANEKLPPDAVKKKLEAAGYSNVHSVEWDDDGYYEADATSPSGKAVDLHVDPVSGKVTKETPD